MIYGVDAVHGFGHPYQATLFPQSIGMGATWDTDLAEAAGAATTQQLLATGGNWDFAPVQDLARDNRWGRYYETWAEEPALAAALGAANIKGLQGGGSTRRRSRRPSSTSPATRSRSTATTGSRRSCRSATCRTCSCRRTRAGSTPARRP